MVTWPRPTPSTSSTELVGPVGRVPMAMPRSRARGMCPYSPMHQYAVPVVWSPETRRHDPRHEVWVGVPTDASERAERVDAILDALRAAGHDLVEAVPQPTTRCWRCTSRSCSRSCAPLL